MVFREILLKIINSIKGAVSGENWIFAFGKTKVQIRCSVPLFSLQGFFLIRNFKLLAILPVSVRPGQKPDDPFSHFAAQKADNTSRQSETCSKSTQDIMYNNVVQFLFLDPKSQAVTVQTSLCGTWLETPKTSFLTMWLI